MFPIASNTDDPRITYVDDVFSTYLYTGNGSPQTINNGIDLAGKGGLVWMKGRSGEYAAYNHSLHDTQRGLVYRLSTNNTNAQSNEPADINSFNSNGFTLGGGALTNDPSTTYTAWTFRKAAKFFDVQTVSHANGLMDTNINLSVLGTVGMVIAKNTSLGGDWIVWHRGLTAGNNSRLNTTAAQSTTNAWLSVSGTTATLSVNAPSGTYVIYAYAHDTAAGGLIQCGSYTGNGSSTNPPNIELGWEPQFILLKESSGIRDWAIVDNMRGLGAPSSVETAVLKPNLVDAETASTNGVTITATGFQPRVAGIANLNGSTNIYMAIRRPNKPPTSGTQVFSPVLYTGNSSANTITTGFPVDLEIVNPRSAQGWNCAFIDRLRGGGTYLSSSGTAAEVATASVPTQFQSNTGTKRENVYFNASPTTFVDYAFRRAPGFFDIVTYTGNSSQNRAIPHKLGVAPDFAIFKGRGEVADWFVWHRKIGSTPDVPSNSYLKLNTTAAKALGNLIFYLGIGTISSTVFGGLGPYAGINLTGQTYVAYLFARLAGISSIDSYTGNGSSQTINCGFAAGARFILIKRTDAAGDWYVWDTARGIAAANDSHSSLNVSAAEVTTDDSIDPDNTGFIVNQVAATNINVTSATYIFLAIS